MHRRHARGCPCPPDSSLAKNAIVIMRRVKIEVQLFNVQTRRPDQMLQPIDCGACEQLHWGARLPAVLLLLLLPAAALYPLSLSPLYLACRSHFPCELLCFLFWDTASLESLPLGLSY